MQTDTCMKTHTHRDTCNLLKVFTYLFVCLFIWGITNVNGQDSRVDKIIYYEPSFEKSNLIWGYI